MKVCFNVIPTIDDVASLPTDGSIMMAWFEPPNGVHLVNADNAGQTVGNPTNSTRERVLLAFYGGSRYRDQLFLAPEQPPVSLPAGWVALIPYN